MSIGNLSKRNLDDKMLSGNAPAPWIRPSDWIAMPAIDEADQKFQGVYAVFEDGYNYCCFMFSGNYHVDWGDGTSENVSAGVKASHSYNYATCGGPSCSRGYKTVLVTVTPQAGQNITSIDLQQKHANITRSDYAGKWLDISINAEYCTSINSLSTQVITFYMCERVVLKKNGCSSFSCLFLNFYSLRSISIRYLSSCTNTSYMFQNCTSLQSVPLFDLSSCTDASWMFYGCTSLQSVPLFNLSSCTNASYMLYNCTSLQSVPLFNLSSCTNASCMLLYCTSLQSVPLFNLSSCTNASCMLYNCTSLQSVPLFNLSSCTDASYMFYGCISLQLLPTFNLSSCTNASNMFYSCKYLNKFTCSTLGQTFSIQNCDFSATALNALYTSLKTVTGKTLTVTGNPGCFEDTPSIATAKGWTVTG